MEAINSKLLRGLRFRTSEPKTSQDENGVKKTRHYPMDRALRPDDVLDWKDKGDKVVIVTNDGQKYTVAKEPADEKAKGGKSAEKGGDAGAAS